RRGLGTPQRRSGPPPPARPGSNTRELRAGDERNRRAADKEVPREILRAGPGPGLLNQASVLRHQTSLLVDGVNRIRSQTSVQPSTLREPLARAGTED